MKWEQVRQQYPEQWVLIEAISGYSEDSIRHIDEVSVVSTYSNSSLAWKEYKRLHLSNRSREYYIFHTDHEVLEITEQKFTGVRGRLQ